MIWMQTNGLGGRAHFSIYVYILLMVQAGTECQAWLDKGYACYTKLQGFVHLWAVASLYAPESSVYNKLRNEPIYVVNIKNSVCLV